MNLSMMLERTPVTLAALLAYVGLAAITGILGPTPEALIDYGAAVPALVAAGEPWRLVTYSFLHGGLLHLLFNGFALLQIGPFLEVRFGSLRFAWLYIIASIGGGVGAMLAIDPIEEVRIYTPTVGGSGALFGMLGALIGGALRGARSTIDALADAALRRLLTFVGIYIVAGMLIPIISNSAHLGGLFTGFGLAYYFLEPDRVPTRATAAPSQVTGTVRRTFIRIGLVTLLAGWTLYTIFPVLRADYQLARQYALREQSERSQAWREARGEPLPVPPDLDQFWGRKRAARFLKRFGE